MPGLRLKNIGSPSQDVIAWLKCYAESNDEAASHAIFPWSKAKFRGQAWAFRTAADMVRQACLQTS